MNGSNMRLNGEWANHVRKFTKRLTSKLRRKQGKKVIREYYT